MAWKQRDGILCPSRYPGGEWDQQIRAPTRDLWAAGLEGVFTSTTFASKQESPKRLCMGLDLPASAGQACPIPHVLKHQTGYNHTHMEFVGLMGFLSLVCSNFWVIFIKCVKCLVVSTAGYKSSNGTPRPCMYNLTLLFLWGSIHGSQVKLLWCWRCVSSKWVSSYLQTLHNHMNVKHFFIIMLWLLMTEYSSKIDMGNRAGLTWDKTVYTHTTQKIYISPIQTVSLPGMQKMGQQQLKCYYRFLRGAQWVSECSVSTETKLQISCLL